MVSFLLWGGQKVDLELIDWSSFSPSSSSLSMRRCLSRRAATSIVAPTPVSSRLSRTAADCHFLLLVVVVVVVVTIMIAIVVVVVVVVVVAPSSSSSLSSSPVAIVVSSGKLASVVIACIKREPEGMCAGEEA